MLPVRSSLVLAAAAIALTAACSSPDEQPIQNGSPFQPSTSYEQVTDPYSSSGTWAIPEQIKPGRYKVTANSDPVTSLRWYTLCADKYCERSLSETTRYASEGGDYVVIPDDGSVRGIKNNGVKLGAAE